MREVFSTKLLNRLLYRKLQTTRNSEDSPSCAVNMSLEMKLFVQVDSFYSVGEEGRKSRLKSKSIKGEESVGVELVYVVPFFKKIYSSTWKMC